MNSVSKTYVWFLLNFSKGKPETGFFVVVAIVAVLLLLCEQSINQGKENRNILFLSRRLSYCFIVDICSFGHSHRLTFPLGH